MNLAGTIRAPRLELSDLLDDLLAETPPEILGAGIDRRYWKAALLNPAHDILQRPGKGFRSQLFESSWMLAGGAPSRHPRELQLLVELLHAGSLIIDDIEDDSETRRGEPSLHRRFGVPIALNTGNWLYFLPLALLSRLNLPRDLTLALYTDIADAIVQCHQGQALDLSAHVTSVRQSEMPGLVRLSTQLKTGALTRLAATMGARAAAATPSRLAAVARFGARIGVGLQMLDDWSGIAADARRHKGVEDLRLGRPTWPWAWLAERSDDVSYAAAVRDAEHLSIDWEAERLRERLRTRLVDAVPGEIAAFLAETLAELHATLGPSPALEDLTRHVEQLSKAYG